MMNLPTRESLGYYETNGQPPAIGDVLCTRFLLPETDALYHRCPLLYLLIETLKLRGFNIQEARPVVRTFLMREVGSGRMAPPFSSDLGEDGETTYFFRVWKDQVVHRHIPKRDERYVHSEVDLFTPSRVELGLAEMQKRSDIQEALRTFPDLEDYQNFVIGANVPPAFIMNIPRQSLANAFASGTIGRTELHATHAASVDRLRSGEEQVIVTDIDVRGLYTDTLTGSGVGSRRFCIYYDTPISASSIRPITSAL